jgi:hypothetical protein
VSKLAFRSLFSELPPVQSPLSIQHLDFSLYKSAALGALRLLL